MLKPLKTGSFVFKTNKYMHNINNPNSNSMKFGTHGLRDSCNPATLRSGLVEDIGGVTGF